MQSKPYTRRSHAVGGEVLDADHGSLNRANLTTMRSSKFFISKYLSLYPALDSLNEIIFVVPYPIYWLVLFADSYKYYMLSYKRSTINEITDNSAEAEERQYSITRYPTSIIILSAHVNVAIYQTCECLDWVKLKGSNQMNDFELCNFHKPRFIVDFGRNLPTSDRCCARPWIWPNLWSNGSLLKSI